MSDKVKLRRFFLNFCCFLKGGINAALGNMESDDWRWHMYDTVKGNVNVYECFYAAKQ